MSKESDHLIQELEEFILLFKKNPAALEEWQFKAIADTLHIIKEQMHIFNYTTASRFLGINPRTLRRKVMSGEVAHPLRKGNTMLSFSVDSILSLFRNNIQND